MYQHIEFHGPSAFMKSNATFADIFNIAKSFYIVRSFYVSTSSALATFLRFLYG